MNRSVKSGTRRTWSLLLMVVALPGAISCDKRRCAPSDATCQDIDEPPPPPLTEPRLTVATTNDLINGNVSDPARLVATPGPDGISLREAISAVNTNTGTTPFEITFDPSLLGKTITLNSLLPPLSRNGTVLLGLNGSDSVPGITLSGGGTNLSRAEYPILLIRASNIRITRLRFSDVLEDGSAIWILAGAHSGLQVTAPQAVTGIRIEDNRFDNAPRSTRAYGVRIGTSLQAVGTRISNVTVARNSFHYFRNDGTTVMLHNNGQHGIVERVDIHDNTFSECIFCVELTNVDGWQNTIQDTRVVRNVFTTANSAITLGQSGPGSPAVTRNSILRTLISENRFFGNRRSAVGFSGGYRGAQGNTVSDVWITNNIVANQPVGFSIVGGTEGADSNRVEHVRIAHNTIDGVITPLTIHANDVTTTGNVVADVIVMNSIFWNSGDPLAETVRQYVFSSIIRTASGNGNLNADPLFVAPGAGDFRLQPGSPAIDRGIAQCPVAMDFFCAPRAGPPDLGAIEFGSTQGSCGSALPQFPLPCTLNDTDGLGSPRSQTAFRCVPSVAVR